MDSVFKLCDRRFQLDSEALRARRQAAGASQTEFAVMCGWSSAYQCRLENAWCDRPLEVSESTALIVDGVLREIEERKRISIEKERQRFEQTLED